MNFRPDSMLSEEFLKTSDSLFACVVRHSPELRKGQLERLIRSYGPPLAAYLIKRRHVQPDVAEELLQNFLLEKLIEPSPEGNIASQFLKRRKEKPDIRFRDYLRRALRNYLYDLSRKKKLTTINLDGIGEHSEDPQLDEIDELEYDVTWANNLLNQACISVRAECHLKKQSQVALQNKI